MHCISSVVNGISTADGTADLFASYHQSLYTSVFYDSETEGIQHSVDKSITTSFDHQLALRADDVTNAINKLKSGKSDGYSGLSSDYFKHGPRELVVYISLLLTAYYNAGIFHKHCHSYRVTTPPGKSWNFFCKISRTWKVESSGNLSARSWKVLDFARQ